MPLPLFDGHTNMRLDTELLARAEGGEASWRVYGWDGPWVSLGRFQDPLLDLRPGCPAPWTMRPTGGRAVLHGHDVTVGLALPLAHLAEPDENLVTLARSVRRAYRAVAAPLIEALRACGVPAALGETTRFAVPRGPRSSDCFAAVSPADIVHEVTAQKVCGCALRLTDRAVLVQASVPTSRPLVDLSQVYVSPAPVAWSAMDGDAFAEALAAILLTGARAR